MTSRNGDGCRCVNGLDAYICKPVYPSGRSTAKKLAAGRMLICVEDPDRPSGTKGYSFSLFLYGECPANDDRYLGYDTAHDLYHQNQYGDCHKHECIQRASYQPCDYDTVYQVFCSEVRHELQNRNIRASC